ncbi:hypothetical protein GGR42_002428 [Saonia flava]|uniref:DUF4304 domain-containing protein n=1 Tax=Saonia flava TaxID=523696 RepID=A0A846QSL8_9FLAO|nr:DUF4304 domain-containing protein [Saonia flava]NJB71966.1 hypothetical protein [Saonia flava]
MNAKEKQKEFIGSYLKPKLKEEGFRTSGQTWWKIIDDFFILINLQNSQWNSKEELSFCFNIGVGLTEKMKDPNRKKATYFDLAVPLREDTYLKDNRREHKYRKDGWLGYKLTGKTDLSDFTNELKTDFEIDILPKLNGLKTLDDCLEFYGQFEFWNNVLKTQVEELRKK